MTLRQSVAIFILAAIWGASFLFLRIGSHEFGPIALIFVRTAIAALVLLPFTITSTQRKRLVQHWKMFIVLGSMSTALPFTLLGYSTLYLTSGHTSILNAITPIFGAGIAFFWLKENQTSWTLLGILLGFIGVVILSWSSSKSFDLLDTLPILSAIIATFCYAASSCYAKIKLAQMDSLIVASGSMLYASLILLPPAIIFWPSKTPSSLAWYTTIALGIMCTAVALLIYFRLIKSMGVTKTMSVTYLIPVFAVIWGYSFLDEPVSLQMLCGGSLILLGIAFTTGLFNLAKIKDLCAKKP